MAYRDAGPNGSSSGFRRQAPLRAFADKRLFVQLRVEPFHRVCMTRHPDLAPAIEAVVRGLLDSNECLVHGDFSPKNMLVGPRDVWVLDWEVAHVGSPTFDRAYLLSHLILKAVYRPQNRGHYRGAADAFLEAYGEADESPSWLAANVACLLLARVDGKSPASYLTARGRETVRSVARSTLADATSSLEMIWARCEHV